MINIRAFLFGSLLFFHTINFSNAIADDVASKSNTIRLGMISPLTGDYAVYGEHVKREFVLKVVRDGL